MAPKKKRTSKHTPVAQRRGDTPKKTEIAEASKTPAEPQAQNFPPAPVPFEWTPERSCQLLLSMVGRKPAGINKHLNMILIRNNLNQRLKMNVPTAEIWKFLKTHWNLELADKIEEPVFNIPDRDFKIPALDEWLTLYKDAQAKLAEYTQKNHTLTIYTPPVNMIKLKSMKVVLEKLDTKIMEKLINKSREAFGCSTTSKNGPNTIETASTLSNVNVNKRVTRKYKYN